MKKIGAWPESKWVRVSERFPAKPLLIIFFALVMLFAFSADAEALMIKLEIDELADQSDIVIVGTVQSIESNWNDNRSAIYSTVTLSVEIVLDGEKQQDTVTVVVPGGEVDGIREIVLTSPVFEIGDQVLLFLSETSAKNFSIGSSQVKQYELSGNFQGRIPVQSKAVVGIPLDQLADDFSLLRQGKIVREDLHYINKPDGTVLTTLNAEEQFALLGVQWPGDFPEIEFKINAPSDVSAEIRDAAETWNSAGANFSFVYAGTHSREGSAEYNGINEIIWTELDASSLAIARIWSAGSQIRETDMVFNTNYNWSTSNQAISDHYDVQTITLHELGHWLGLAHPEVTESVMYYRYQGIQRQLYAVDVAGIKYLYGEASEVQEEEEPVAEFIVNTSLNPDEGGIVNGSGTYEEGSNAEVNVEVFKGFDFVNWTENGKEVSTNSEYSFTVTGNRKLVANFKHIDSTPVAYGVGLYQPDLALFHIKNDFIPGPADSAFSYGEPLAGWLPVAGDWTSSGNYGVAVFDQAAGLFYIKYDTIAGPADEVVEYGAKNEGWLPVAGDWNGDGTYGVGLFDPITATFYIKQTATPGPADVVVSFGQPGAGWLPIAGDWNGNGTYGLGLYDPASAIFYIKDTATPGHADETFSYGAPGAGWLPLAGDWNGDGRFGVAVYDSTLALFRYRNTATAGHEDGNVFYGPAPNNWLPVAGRWVLNNN